MPSFTLIHLSAICAFLFLVSRVLSHSTFRCNSEHHLFLLWLCSLTYICRYMHCHRYILSREVIYICSHSTVLFLCASVLFLVNMLNVYHFMCKHHFIICPLVQVKLSTTCTEWFTEVASGVLRLYLIDAHVFI